MKHRAFTLVEMIVVVLILAVLVAMLAPVFVRVYCTEGRRPQCQENLREIGLAFMQYAQDYDDKLPPVANARAGYWAGSLQPYMKSWQLFQCPTDKTAAPKTTDYYYNSRLAQMSSQTVGTPRAIILSGEGSGDQLTSYHLSQLPAAWRKNQSSPAHRHLDGANYLFADGHVKWLKPEQITLDKSALGNPTFLVK